MTKEMFGGTYAGRRVLVTGHTGFKGSWLTRWLLELGAEVGGLSDRILDGRSLFSALGLQDRVRHLEADVRDSDAVGYFFREFRPDFVFHLAAQALVRPSYDAPAETFSTNLMGTVNVLDALRERCGVRAAVFITSDKCYENVEWLYGYRETDTLGGADPYSASKACAEMAISAYSRSYFRGTGGPRIASARAGNVIGGGDWARDRIFPDCARAWSRGETVEIRNPASTRPWQHVLEPLSGYLWLGARLAAEPEGIAGEAFNFGPAAEESCSVAQLIAMAERTWLNAGRWSEVTSTSTKKEAGLLRLNCDKALLKLKWRPTLQLAEAVDMTTGWYRANSEKHEAMDELTTAQLRRYMALAAERRIPWASRYPTASTEALPANNSLRGSGDPARYPYTARSPHADSP